MEAHDVVIVDRPPRDDAPSPMEDVHCHDTDEEGLDRESELGSNQAIAEEQPKNTRSLFSFTFVSGCVGGDLTFS